MSLFQVARRAASSPEGQEMNTAWQMSPSAKPKTNFHFVRLTSCSLERLASEAEDRDLRVKETAKKRLDGLIQELSET